MHTQTPNTLSEESTSQVELKPVYTMNTVQLSYIPTSIKMKKDVGITLYQKPVIHLRVYYILSSSSDLQSCSWLMTGIPGWLRVTT